MLEWVQGPGARSEYREAGGGEREADQLFWKTRARTRDEEKPQDLKTGSVIIKGSQVLNNKKKQQNPVSPNYGMSISDFKNMHILLLLMTV